MWPSQFHRLSLARIHDEVGEASAIPFRNAEFSGEADGFAGALLLPGPLFRGASPPAATGGDSRAAHRRAHSGAGKTGKCMSILTITWSN